MRKTEGALRARKIKEKTVFRENFLFYDILVCQDVCFELKRTMYIGRKCGIYQLHF